MASGASGVALGLVPPLPIIGGLLGQGGEPPAQAPSHARHEVRAVSTGDRSELIKRLPITRRAGSRPRVAMSLGPSKLGTLRAGQRIHLSAEVEVSTTCVDPGRRCIGRRYGFNPSVRARLYLGRKAHGLARSVPVSDPEALRCSQRRPNRNHHCTLVIRGAGFRVARDSRLPCQPDRCHVNLVLDAHNRRARKGNVLVVGADRPDGKVEQDKGRINALILGKGVRRSDRARFAQGSPARRSLPVGNHDSGGQTVIYSLPLRHLRRGDALDVRARAVTAIGRLPYNVYIGAHLVLAPGPSAVSPGRVGRRVGSQQGKLDEVNGFNCTHGPSAFKDPCVTRKVGVLRIKRAPAAVGHAGPMYLNLVAHASALLAKAGEGDRARELGRGALVAVRYRP